MYTDTRIEKGWIEVISGSMYSGKTEELIRRVRRALLANKRALIFKPSMDTRYSVKKVVSHDRNSVESIPVDCASEIIGLSSGCELVAIDEAQFFGEDLLTVCTYLAREKIRVIVAGLDMDYLGAPFGPMPSLLSVAEYVTKVHAVCMQCGDMASHTFKRVNNDLRVELGERELYEARCRNCFDEGMARQKDQITLDI